MIYLRLLGSRMYGLEILFHALIDNRQYLLVLTHLQ
jgi:hypothetical protein